MKIRVLEPSGVRRSKDADMVIIASSPYPAEVIVQAEILYQNISVYLSGHPHNICDLTYDHQTGNPK